MVARMESSRASQPSTRLGGIPRMMSWASWGRRTLCTKRWALNTRNSPTAMASRERALRLRARASPSWLASRAGLMGSSQSGLLGRAACSAACRVGASASESLKTMRSSRPSLPSRGWARPMSVTSNRSMGTAPGSKVPARVRVSVRGLSSSAPSTKGRDCPGDQPRRLASGAESQTLSARLRVKSGSCPGCSPKSRRKGPGLKRSIPSNWKLRPCSSLSQACSSGMASRAGWLRTKCT
ncbi:hypothetical protein D3C81_511630 [compost metagenome]